MKTLKIITCAILLIIANNQNSNAQAFVKVGGQATDVAISPKDGSVYVVNASKNVKKYYPQTKKFMPFSKQSETAASISVNQEGIVHMVSTSNEPHIEVNGKWIKIPGVKTKEIDIDKNGNVRLLDLNGKLKKLAQGKWQDETIINRNTNGFNQVVGQSTNTLFARFKDNAFKVYTDHKWSSLNGNPLKITMDDATGIVYAVGRNKGIYKWDMRNKKWHLLKNTRKDFKDVAVHNGKIWAVAEDKGIYYYDSKTIGAIDYAGTYRVTLIRIADISETEFFGAMGIYLEAKSSSGNITIKPKDNKPNRMWDVSKGNPVKLRPAPVMVYGKQFINTKFKDGPLSHSTNVDIMREFVIAGEAANKHIVFDFQFNIKQKTVFGEEGKWVRQKLKVTDLKLNFEYVYYNEEAGCFIFFKIEKI
ncbi:hypothetical protein [Psychroserpens sp.]|uniref:hypothetical protein n=1 Tax=Psychroserpens sp. TaxID=2020870 RepID=UPI003C759099